MAKRNVKGLNATETNYQTLIRLKAVVKDKKIRHEIVFYDTFIGSHEARKNYPENFNNARHVTGSIFEADYISRQREETLNRLEKGDVNRVLLELKRKARLLHLEKVEYTHGLYSHLYMIKNNFIERIGNKLEESLTAHKRIIRNSKEERKIKYFFNREAGCMSGIVFMESEDMHRKINM